MKLVMSLLTASLSTMIIQGETPTFPSNRSKTTIDSIESLINILTETQTQLQPISPPSSNMFIEKKPIPYPVNWEAFDRQMTKHMIAYMDQFGLPRYELLIWEDIQTRDKVISLAETGLEIARIPASTEYVPEQYYQSMLKRGARYCESMRWIFDPAHTAVSIELIPETLYSAYEQAETEQLQASFMQPSAMTIPPPVPDGSSGGGTDNVNQLVGSLGSISFVRMTIASNSMVTMNISIPHHLGSGYLEIFSKDSLSYSLPWKLTQDWLSTHGKTNITWTDSSTTHKKQNYYLIADADNDSDGDGYSDLRETFDTGTSPTNFNHVNDDGDDMHDWYELKFFGDLDQTGDDDFDGDGLLNNEEMIYLESDVVSPKVIVETNPAQQDTDGNGIMDSAESKLGLQFLNANQVWQNVDLNKPLYTPIDGFAYLRANSLDPDPPNLLTWVTSSPQDRNEYFCYDYIYSPWTPHDFSYPGDWKLGIEVEPFQEKNGYFEEITVRTFDLELITPTGDPAKEQIIDGDGQNIFCYENAKLSIPVKIELESATLADSIEDQFRVNLLKSGDTVASGNTVFQASDNFLKATIIRSGMPTNNAGFGRRRVYISSHGNPFDGDGNSVLVFYEPLDKAPNGDRCWYTYYKDGVINDLARFEAVNDGAPVLEAEENETVHGAYFPDFREGTYYYYIGANEQLYINQDVFGSLAEVADTVAHEIKHYDLMHQVNDAYISIYQSFINGTITAAERDQQFAKVDSDGDWVKDTIDPNIGQDDQEEIAHHHGIIHWLDHVDDITADWSLGGYHGGL